MNKFKKAKHYNYYDKVGIDHDNIKKNKLSQIFFNVYYYYFHEKRNSIVYKTDNLIVGSNLLLDILLAYKLAYLELEQYLINKTPIKTITVCYNKNMDFWNYNIPITPLFRNLLEKKIKEFDLTHHNILSSTANFPHSKKINNKSNISNISDSKFFTYITNPINHQHLDNKKMIEMILEDLSELNRISNNPFIQFINLADYQIYNLFNISKVCKKEGLANESYAYDNVLRLASSQEVNKLNYPQDYEYLKENLKRVSSYDYLYEDIDKILNKYKDLKINMQNVSPTTLCPDYKIFTYYILSQNIFFTSSINLHPWGRLKINHSSKNSEYKEVLQKTLYEFGENLNENTLNNVNNLSDNQSNLKTYEEQLIKNSTHDYFMENKFEMINFDYIIQVLNKDNSHHFYGTSKRIANSAYSFMVQPLLDIETIF